MLHRTSTHAIVALIAVALAVTGVFVASERLTASAEALVAGVSGTSVYVTPSVRLEPSAARVLPKPVVAAELMTRLFPPMDRALERVTKKPFGIEIHPETSPVPNDRFDGFHVGTDFETFEEEQAADVAVYAVCDGRLRYATWARGYGGVAVQACRIDGLDVSVIYGHLDVASVAHAAGDELKAGDLLGFLGEGASEETDGVRKHLHLGLRVDSTDDIRGYVRSATETDLYLDPLPRIR